MKRKLSSEDKKLLAARFTQLLELRGYNPSSFARRCELSQSAIWLYCHGAPIPPIRARQFADILMVNPEYLLDANISLSNLAIIKPNPEQFMVQFKEGYRNRLELRSAYDMAGVLIWQDQWPKVKSWILAN